MGQQTYLRELDDMIGEVMDDTGLRDAATLVRKSGGSESCHVYVDESTERFGEQGQVVVTPAIVHAFKNEIAAQPRAGDRFEITDGDAVWTIDALEREDASRWVFRCKAGR
jgi:hypothetical protein